MPSRRLSAVMFADLVGYTALMGKDEDLAMAHRERQRQALEREIPEHGGEIIQFYGDGALVTFPSAVEAVEAAVDIQQDLRSSEPIPMRIGIHVGDIVIDQDGAWGNGVNLASRIESSAIAGSILISDRVQEEIQNHPHIHTKKLGSFRFKNVTRPVTLFSISADGLVEPESIQINATREGQKKSIAVLPFANMSSGEEAEFFGDGLAEEILNLLAKVDGVKVTARTSSFAFKNKNVDLREVGRQLGVAHILEGSIRKAGNRVRITAQLISSSDGYHLWSETYDRTLDDVFGVQDEIAGKILIQLREKLEVDQKAEQKEKKNQEIDAAIYETYLKARYHLNRWTVEDSHTATALFEKVKTKYPKYAAAYSGLAQVYSFMGATGKMEPHFAFSKARAFALDALQLDPDDERTQIALANIYFWYDWDWQRTESCINKALEINDSSADGLLFRAFYNCSRGRMKEAFEDINTAISIDPLSAPAHYGKSCILFFQRRYEEAIACCEDVLKIDEHFVNARAILGFSQSRLGNYDEGIHQFQIVQRSPGFGLLGIAGIADAKTKAGKVDEAKRLVKGILQEGNAHKDPTFNLSMAYMYLKWEDYDTCFEYLNRCLEQRNTELIFLAVNEEWIPIRKDPRFKKLLEKVDLPEIRIDEN
jgi:TolB-like protein